MKGIKEITTGNNSTGLEFTSKQTKGILKYLEGEFNVDSPFLVNGVDVTPGQSELMTSAGVSEQPTIVYNTGLGTVTLGQGNFRFFHSTDYTGPVSEHTIATATLSIADNLTSYVIASYNGGTPIYAVTEDVASVEDATTNIIYTVYRSGDNFSVINWDEPGLGLSNKTHRRLIETERFARVYGFDISEYGTRNLLVSAGKAWQGAYPNYLDEVNSIDDQYILWTNNGDSTFSWAEVTQYTNTEYDPKTGTLATLTDGDYGIIWVYRSMSIDSKTVHLILGNQGYDLNGAKAAQPVEVPQLFGTNAVLIGKVIILKGDVTATEIDSAFETTFAASVTTNHGGLTGLTGGHLGVHDHLPIYNADGVTEILGVDAVENRVRCKNIDSPISNYLGNGILSGFTISINTDTTKIDISAGVGNSVVNIDPTNPVWTTVEFAGVTGLTLTNIATANATYLAINSASEVLQQTTPFTASQRSAGLLILGAAIHSNRVNVNVINNLPDVILDSTGQYNELVDSLHNFNIEGNIFTANGANFNINKSSGKIFKRGCNFENDPLNPHVKSMAALTAPTNLRYRLQDGTEYADTNIIDHLNYDNAGVLTAVPNKKWTAQRITLFPSNIVRIQYGQALYDSAAEAIQGISVDDFVFESNIADNGLLRCILIVSEDSVNLTSATFLEASKFGDTSTTGSGSAVTTLQQAYGNSLQPQITTSTASGAVQIKRGSAADTDNVLEVQNGAGSTNAAITGEGKIGLGVTGSASNVHIKTGASSVTGVDALGRPLLLEDDLNCRLGLAVSNSATSNDAGIFVSQPADDGANNIKWSEFTASAASGKLSLTVGNAEPINMTSTGVNLNENTTVDGNILAIRFGPKLYNVSTQVFETAVQNREYYSPNQHGDIYGAVYRQYHGAKTDGQTITATGITKLVSYGGTINGDNCYFGATTGSSGLVNAWRSTNIIQFTISSWTVDSGWVDYTK